MEQEEGLVVPEPSAGSGRSFSRRAFLHSSILGVSGLALASCTRGIMDRNEIEITHRTFHIPNLPAEWDGKTITFLSDIHSGPFMDVDDLKRVVKTTNELNSDLIVMPGDFVTSSTSELPPLLEAMSELRAPMGVFACTGNHDYYAGVDDVSRGVEDTPIQMLRNSNAKLMINGQPLYLIGVDDDDAKDVTRYVEGHAAPHIEAAYHGVPENAASVLMCHKPYHFESFAKTNVGLMLSGHTHGGQIVLGRIGETVMAFSTIASKYVEGIYLPRESRSQTQMYVSRGIGVVGLPIRINCPPEITRITLARPVV
ncbi:MAG: metallophosphoesterase [Bacteroidota bacterium]|nr:metallophosphoesterase [Bacteroidota bacterium]MDP4243675.1 metallophosphoesterase [Bacteroidota bacterium]MDP4287736.1 metallophosphoesterase [Bacteroidota bacterium]